MPDGKFITVVSGGLVGYAEATPEEIGAVASSMIDAPNGVAPLGPDSIVPAENLPAGFNPTVVEVANFAALPATGDPAKIYKTMNDGKTWKWGGTSYAQISGGLVLGETNTTAYRGDRGAEAYETALLAEPGLGAPSVTSFLRSTAAGVRAWVQLVATDITDLGTVLAGYLTKNNPAFTGTVSGPLVKIGGGGGTSPSTATPFVALANSGFCTLLAQTGSGNHGANHGVSSSNGSWYWGIRDDGASGCPVGAWVINDSSDVRVWGTAAGMWIRGALDVNGAISQAGVQRITAGGEGRFDGLRVSGLTTGALTKIADANGQLAAAVANTDYLSVANPAYTGALKQGATEVITADRKFRGTGATLTGVLNGADAGFSGGVALYGDLDLFGLPGSGPCRTLGVDPDGKAIVATGATIVSADGNLGDIPTTVVGCEGSVVLTLANGADGQSWEVWGLSAYTIRVPSGVKLWAYAGTWVGPEDFTPGGGRSLRITRLNATIWLLPNYG